MFTKFDVLLDNEASLNIFSNQELPTDVRIARKSVTVSGIDRSGSVEVLEEGDFWDLGKVYYSESASANVLPFASQVDSGADIRYDHQRDSFTLRPKHGNLTYVFGRKVVPGREGSFYTYDWR